MWLLTCEGDLFGGKRLWLRPGSTHLLGRTSGRGEAGQRIQYIDHRSVSRKHLLIEVGRENNGKSGNSSKLHTRSEIKVKDGSKIGTTVNGEKFSQETRTLNEKEYTIKLGNYEHLFRLWWHPLTLSFSSTSKKSKDDPLASWREKFDQTDIKLITDYVANGTTHCIAKKRNIPAALQALMQAKWVVTDEFVDALAVAVERRHVDGTSLLEEDFGANWPKEEDYIVPAGKEPQPKPDEYLKPNPERQEVFQNYVFIFLSQVQHETLLPVITTGGGKALLWEVEIGRSKVEDVVEYVKEVAGKKNSNQFRLSQDTSKGGIVVVRLNERDEGWREFMRAVDLALDQRSIEQNQFLDVILTMDTSSLRKQLEEEPESSNVNPAASAPAPRPQVEPRDQQRAVTVHDSPPPAEQPPPSEQLPLRTQPQAEDQPMDQSPEQPSTASRRRNRRIITQSRFKGFDDFDPSQFSKPASRSPEPSFNEPDPSQAPSEPNMDFDEPSQPSRTQQNSRKRPAPVREEEEREEEEDMYASILTGHAAMKRQKTAAGQNGAASTNKATAVTATENAGKAKKKEKEIDVMAEVKARREREEEKHRQDNEKLKEAMEGVNISDLKNLAQIEEMELPAREPPTRRGGESGRWDPAWNGRKNFKKFRPQGQRQDGPRLQRVIVTLEEVPRKGHGIGEEYWLSSASTTAASRGKSKSKSQQSQSQSVRQGPSQSQRAQGEGEEDAAVTFRRRIQSSRDQDEANAATENILPEEIAGHARDEGLEAAANEHANSTPSQTLGTASQRKAAGKRPAAQQVRDAPPPKKARQSRLAPPPREAINLDGDDDDGLKFRRRRKG